MVFRSREHKWLEKSNILNWLHCTQSNNVSLTDSSAGCVQTQFAVSCFRIELGNMFNFFVQQYSMINMTMHSPSEEFMLHEQHIWCDRQVD